MHFVGLQDVLLGLDHSLKLTYPNVDVPLLVRRDVASLPGYEWHNLRADIVLNPDHPATPSLLAEAGVGIDRLDKPVASGMRVDFLGVGRESIDEAANEAGGDEVSTRNPVSCRLRNVIGADRRVFTFLLDTVQVQLGPGLAVQLRLFVPSSLAVPSTRCLGQPPD